MTETTKTLRMRLNISRTSKGYSIDSTVETTDINQDFGEMAELQEAVLMNRMRSLMKKAKAEYPKEAE